MTTAGSTCSLRNQGGWFTVQRRQGMCCSTCLVLFSSCCSYCPIAFLVLVQLTQYGRRIPSQDQENPKQSPTMVGYKKRKQLPIMVGDKKRKQLHQRKMQKEMKWMGLIKSHR